VGKWWDAKAGGGKEICKKGPFGKSSAAFNRKGEVTGKKGGNARKFGGGCRP